ncbi:MAG: ATP-binding protein [Mucinivorans sp.]
MRYGYRLKLVYVVIGALIGFASLYYSNYLASELAKKEKREIQLWSQGLALSVNMDQLSQIQSDILLHITQATPSIPAIVTDSYLRVLDYRLVDTSIINNPNLLRLKLEQMASGGRTPIEIQRTDGVVTVFYDDSPLLYSTFLFPYIQLGLIAVFITFVFFIFSSAKQSEQNRVWVGMAKETAHQLGTPTSSLMGWIEYLRDQPIPPDVVDDIERDVVRLGKVVDRFSKIGSDTNLEAHNIQQIVNSTVQYFQTRIPRGVTINYQTCADEPYQALVNEALFEWVLENLMKNALDAMMGKGELTVRISNKDNNLRIDISDTGKGIAKANVHKIFHPGFTTKTRGWGLGLSLSRRIIEEYHKGKIFVLRSELDRGTTMRIVLRRL